MYFSGSAATALILFGGRRAARLPEDQGQRHPENGQHDAGGAEGEGGATRKVSTAPQRSDQEEKRAQHRQPVGGPSAPGQLHREHTAQTGEVDENDQGERREQRVRGG